jgi:glycosyltransferase involved in cell wall biosynthesis
VNSSFRQRLARLFRLPGVTITQIGNPLHATGRGEHVRAIFRALRKAGLTPKVYRLNPHVEVTDPGIQAHLVEDTPAGGIRLFHCNGNEARMAIETIERRQPGAFAAGYNIIFPAWELPRYPLHWAQELNRFDEVWAATQFVYEGLREVVTVPLLHMHNACQPVRETLLDRSYFRLEEADYVVLFFFDYNSFEARKNPLAAIEAFRQAVAARPDAKLRLVIKANHPPATDVSGVADAVRSLGDRAVFLDRTMTDNEIKNLIGVSDCFLSLHRSEGFGRGPAEAMFLGKPAIATGWSGNMDYMTPSTSFPIGYRLISVRPEEYLETEDQVWADPDPAEAARALVRLVDDRELGPRIGRAAAQHMQQHFGDEVLGHRYRARFEDIARTRRKR